MYGNYTEIRPADHDGWLEERKKGIGSSEAGTLMGVNHHDTPYRLWRRKLGIDGPVPSNETMELGHDHEPGVATFFERTYHEGRSINGKRARLLLGRNGEPNSEGDWIARSNDKPFLQVSPDRLWVLEDEDPNDKANWRILEIKTTNLEVNADDIPDYWYAQVTYQMGVMGIKKGAIAWLSAFPNLHQDYLEVDFNQAYFETIIKAIENFWNENIIKKMTPPVTTVEDVHIRYPEIDEGARMVADETIMEIYTKYKSTNTAFKALKKQVDEYKDQIRVKMQDFELMYAPDAKKVIAVLMPQKSSMSFNEERFKSENPELYKQYVEETFSKPMFKIK